MDGRGHEVYYLWDRLNTALSGGSPRIYATVGCAFSDPFNNNYNQFNWKGPMMANDGKWLRVFFRLSQGHQKAANPFQHLHCQGRFLQGGDQGKAKQDPELQIDSLIPNWKNHMKSSPQFHKSTKTPRVVVSLNVGSWMMKTGRLFLPLLRVAECSPCKHADASENSSQLATSYRWNAIVQSISIGVTCFVSLDSSIQAYGIL